MQEKPLGPELLRSWIAREDLSKAEAARKVGTSRAMLWRYLNGESTPSIDAALKIERGTDYAVRVMDWVKR